MSKFLFYTLLGSALSLSCLSAEPYIGPTKFHFKKFDNLTVHGPTDLNLVKAETLEIKGLLNFSELDVAKTATLTGPIKGNKGKFGSLNITGPFEGHYIMAEDLKVTGPVVGSYFDIRNDTTVVGSLKLIHSKLYNLTVTSDDISLSDSTINNIVIKEDPKNKNQVLTLRGKTSILGTITFESGNGVVKVDGDQVEIKGAVKGGTTEKATPSP